MSALQLRLVLETADLDAALAFYRDALGLPELESYQGEGGARVAILGIPTATLELANSAQVELIDEVEVGRPVAHPFPLRLRVAFEVQDAAATTAALVEAGAVPVAPPTRTPWNSLNARLEGPDGLQLTAFQELGSEQLSSAESPSAG